jgi:hypothetical protein
MPLTDHQKLAVAGAVAAVTTIAALVLLVGYFSSPSRAVEPTPAPALSHRVAALVEELRQLPAEERGARLGSLRAADDVEPNVPALEAAFDALAEADDVQVVRVDALEGMTVEATLEYDDADGQPARVALLLHVRDGRIVPLTITR